MKQKFLKQSAALFGSLLLVCSLMFSTAARADGEHDGDGFQGRLWYEDVRDIAEVYGALLSASKLVESVSRVPLSELEQRRREIEKLRNRTSPALAQNRMLQLEMSLVSAQIREIQYSAYTKNVLSDRKAAKASLPERSKQLRQLAYEFANHTNKHFPKNVELQKSLTTWLWQSRDIGDLKGCDAYKSAIRRLQEIAPDDLSVWSRTLVECYADQPLTGMSYRMWETRADVIAQRLSWLRSRKSPDPISDLVFMRSIYLVGRLETEMGIDKVKLEPACLKSAFFESSINVLNKRYPFLILPIEDGDDLERLDRIHPEIHKSQDLGVRIDVPKTIFEQLSQKDPQVAYDAFAKQHKQLLNQLQASCKPSAGMLKGN